MVTVTTKIIVDSRAHEMHGVDFHPKPKNALNTIGLALLKAASSPHHNEHNERGNTHQALALASPLMPQRPNYNFSNDRLASTLRKSIRSMARQLSPRQARAMSRIFRSMQSPYGFGQYMAAKAMRGLYGNNNMPSSYGLGNNSSFPFNNTRPQFNLLSQSRSAIGDRCPTNLNNCDKVNGYLNPENTFVKSNIGSILTKNNGSTGSVETPGIRFDFNQSEQALTAYNKLTGEKITGVRGDPHYDINGVDTLVNKDTALTFRDPVTKQKVIADINTKAINPNDPKSASYMNSAVILAGNRAVRVGNTDGSVKNSGLSMQDISKREAKKDIKADTNFAFVKADKTYKVKSGNGTLV